jgi:hypothetical protein
LAGDRSRQTPASRAEALQEFLHERENRLDLPDDPKELLRQLRNHLVLASDEGRLATKQHDIIQHVKRVASPFPKMPECVGIVGGEKDLKRTGEKPHFRRPDGGWFFFSLTVRARRGQPLELVGYNFELCFPSQAVEKSRLPRFVRFDLNQPNHPNESRGLRCHFHPGHDDLSAPAPLMSPLDLLDLFIDGLLVPESPREA